MSFFRTLFSSKLFLKPLPTSENASFFHVLSKPTQNTPFISNILVPTVVNLIPACGFKVKGKLSKRCKDCYFVTRQQRLYVLCKTHRRHKQMSMVKDEKSTWILSHATQGKIRPW